MLSCISLHRSNRWIVIVEVFSIHNSNGLAIVQLRAFLSTYHLTWFMSMYVCVCVRVHVSLEFCLNCNWFVSALLPFANDSIQFSIKPLFHSHLFHALTWNDVVNADTISYMISHGWPGSGLNGVNTYCIPNSGTNNNVALNE